MLLMPMFCSRFASHSCSPCAVAEVWEVSGKLRLALFTTRPVTQGKLVTLDLGGQLEVLEGRKICQCEATNCRQLLGSSVVTQQPTLCCSSCCRTPLPPGRTMLHPSLALPSCPPCRDSFIAVARDLKEDRETCRCCGQGQADPARCSQCPAVFCSPCLLQMLGQDYVTLARYQGWCCLLCDSRPLRNLRLLLLYKSGPNVPRGGGKGRGRGRGATHLLATAQQQQAAVGRGSSRGLPSPRLGAVRVRPPGHLLAPRLIPGGRGNMRPRYPGGQGTPKLIPGGQSTPWPRYPGGRGTTRPSTPGLPRPRQTPPSPRIPHPRPRALVFSPPPSLTPTTTYQDDSYSAPASLPPHLSQSLPAHEVSPCTALLPVREEIFLSSDDEGGETLPVSLPVHLAGITISRVGQVTSSSEFEIETLSEMFKTKLLQTMEFATFYSNYFCCFVAFLA